MEVKFNPSYQPFFQTEKRWVILWGGAGSGKSHAVAQKNIMRCMTMGQKHKILMVRKFRTTLERSVFDITKSLIIEYGLSNYVKTNQTKMEFTFENGNSILTTGLDDPEKLKSIHGITTVWIEEATELEEEDIDQLNLRLRGKTDSYKQIIMSFNPISSDHWIYKKYFLKKDEDVFTMNSTYKDNIFLDEEYVRELENRYKWDSNLRRIYVEGKWGKELTGQEFYAHFSHERHVKPCMYEDELPLHLSFDFNTNPYMPLSIWQIKKEKKVKTIERENEIVKEKIEVYVCRNFDEIALENPYNTTEEVCKAFKKRYHDVANGIFYYGDVAGRARLTSNNRHNYEIIDEELKNYIHGWSNRVPSRNPMIAKRRVFINKIMAGGYPDIELIVSPKCEYMIADMEHILQDIDGKKWKPKAKNKAGVVYERYGHFSDCLDYFFCSAFSNYYDEF